MLDVPNVPDLGVTVLLVMPNVPDGVNRMIALDRMVRGSIPVLDGNHSCVIVCAIAKYSTHELNLHFGLSDEKNRTQRTRQSCA